MENNNIKEAPNTGAPTGQNEMPPMPKKKLSIGLFFQCFFLLAIGGIVPSVAATAIYVAKSTQTVLVVCSILSMLITLFWWMYQLFDFRMVIPTLRNYYIYNLSATGLYCAIAVVGQFLFRFTDMTFQNSLVYKIYSYMFYNFKIPRYFSYVDGSYTIGRTTSTVIFSAVCLLTVAVFPLLFNKRKILGLIPGER